MSQKPRAVHGEHAIPFIVNGNGGYHNLHKITGTWTNRRRTPAPC